MKSLVIEGYASLFGVEDLAGDVVRAGAFARSLARGSAVGMLPGALFVTAGVPVDCKVLPGNVRRA